MESSGNEELDRLVSTNEEYKNFVSMIESEVMDVKNRVTWDDIAGLKHVKDAIQVRPFKPLHYHYFVI
jgi:SpoVK/Ycf46/Vps4 family AAA+-type ATPase